MHLHLPHLPVAALALSAVYVLAIAMALAHPGAHTLAGLVVLAGLTARWVAASRRRATVAVLTPEAAPGTAPAA
ncbi:UNVERIFIED_ORG: hypothetical protein E4P37_12420 [Bacillus sp. AZ43]